MTVDPTHNNADATPSTVKERANEAASRARAKATETAERAGQKAREAADKAKASGLKAKQTAQSGIEGNPLVAIAGGVALGAILAGLLPRTATEDRAVGKIGTRVRSTARQAVNTAKENARDQLDELGFNPDSAREKLSGLAGKVAKAAAAVGAATAETTLKKT